MKLTRKIIIAEDNIADLELMKIAIKDTGLAFDIHHVIDGHELIQLVNSTNLNNVDLILLDLNMPRMGGIEVLKHFYKNEQLRMIPVIVFTSSSHQSDVETCYDYGANAYVCKPIDMGEYYKAISSIVNFWTKINLAPTFNTNQIAP